MIRIGFEKGKAEPVNVNISHTVVAGITRSGKSETVKALISRAEDSRFLIFDVKRPRDYSDVGIEIPIFVEEKTDPLMLKRLLESQSHLALKFEFPELIKVCKREDTFNGILRAVNEGLKSKVHPIVENKLLVLQHLLTKLVRELEKTSISDKLVLKDRINVIDLSDVSLELQQLAVHSTFKWILEKERDLIVVLDEAHRFVPQTGSNASKETVTTFIKEGGAKGLWLWLVDQTITGIDKQVLKQCWIWILGKQREVNEAKRTMDQIPFKTGLNEKSIMRLKIGEFVVCTEDGAKVTYVQPRWLRKTVARNVALGKLSVKNVIDDYLKSRRRVDETFWKEKYEQLEREFKKLQEEKDELEILYMQANSREPEEIESLKRSLEEEKRKREQLEKEFADIRTKIYQEAMKKVDEIKSQWNVEKMQKTIAALKDHNNELKSRIQGLEDQLKAFNELREALTKILPVPWVRVPAEGVVTAPSEISISIEQPVISVKVERKPLSLTDKDLHGKIALVYAEGALGNGWFSVSDVVKAFQRHAWPRDPRISKVLDDFCRWRYLEKKYAGRKPIYHTVVKPEEAKAKGILRVQEK